MNTDALRKLTDREPTVEADTAQRLDAVHTRIRRARRRRAVASTGAIVLAAAVGGVALSRAVVAENPVGPSDQTRTPSTSVSTLVPETRVGFIGLPPRGAAPSDPSRARLVLHYFGPDPGGWAKSNLWVYDDGRLIVEREADRPEGANDQSTGYLEQRLTAEGVETLRSYVVSNGEPLVEDPPFPMWLQVRDGDQLLDLDPAEGIDPARLMDPADWLPDSSWEDRAPRAYVPTNFAICFEAASQRVTPGRLLAALPDPAADLLRSRNTTPATTWHMDNGIITKGREYCSVAPTHATRTVVRSLRDAGLRQGDSTYALNYSFKVSPRASQPDQLEAIITFEPVLPDGSWICSACG